MSPESVQQKFTAALDALIAQVKHDRSVLAAILCGSLSHDTVWAQSDIDLALVTIDEKKGSADSIAIYADGVNVHAFLMTRTEFRAVVEGSLHNSFMHALLAKGRLLYTHDETIADLCERLREIGERDRRIQLLRAGCHALSCDREGAQVVRHARRSRLHRPVASVPRHSPGADRGDRGRAAGRSRGDPARR